MLVDILPHQTEKAHTAIIVGEQSSLFDRKREEESCALKTMVGSGVEIQSNSDVAQVKPSVNDNVVNSVMVTSIV